METEVVKNEEVTTEMKKEVQEGPSEPKEESKFNSVEEIMEALKEQTGIEFKRMTSRKVQKYAFGGGNEYLIQNPLALAVVGDIHLILAGDGTSWQIDTAKGFAMQWAAQEGQPFFD